MFMRTGLQYSSTYESLGILQRISTLAELEFNSKLYVKT